METRRLSEADITVLTQNVSSPRRVSKQPIVVIADKADELPTIDSRSLASIADQERQMRRKMPSFADKNASMATVKERVSEWEKKKLTQKQSAMLKRALRQMKTDGALGEHADFKTLAETIVGGGMDGLESELPAEGNSDDEEERLIQLYFDSVPETISVLAAVSPSGNAPSSPAVSFADRHEGAQYPIPGPANAHKTQRTRRETMQSIHRLRKNASNMRVGELIRELDTVISEMDDFDESDFEEASDTVESDGTDGTDELDDESELSLNEVEKDEENQETSVVLLNRDSELVTEISLRRHPPHLMRHLDRSSLYTDIEESPTSDLNTNDSQNDLSGHSAGMGKVSPPLPPPRARAVVSPKPKQTSATSFLPPMNIIKRVLSPLPRSISSPSSPPERSSSPVSRTASPLERSATALSQRLSILNYYSDESPQRQQHQQVTVPRTISTPLPHRERIVAKTPIPDISEQPETSPLLSSEDDPEAISSQLKLYSPSFFSRPWQQIVLVLSPHKRALYYVRIKKIKNSQKEQVVGFIEITPETVVESVENLDKGKKGAGGLAISSAFKGKPVFVVFVPRSSGKGMGRDYYYFMAKESQDMEKWVQTLKNFIEKLQRNTGNKAARKTIPPATEDTVVSFLTQEELSSQLQKQQRLLVQQRALMAAVSAQLELQQKFTADLAAAQMYQLQRDRNEFSSNSRRRTSIHDVAPAAEEATFHLSSPNIQDSIRPAASTNWDYFNQNQLGIRTTTIHQSTINGYELNAESSSLGNVSPYQTTSPMSNYSELIGGLKLRPYPELPTHLRQPSGRRESLASNSIVSSPQSGKDAVLASPHQSYLRPPTPSSTVVEASEVGQAGEGEEKTQSSVANIPAGVTRKESQADSLATSMDQNTSGTFRLFGLRRKNVFNK